MAVTVADIDYFPAMTEWAMDNGYQLVFDQAQSRIFSVSVATDADITSGLAGISVATKDAAIDNLPIIITQAQYTMRDADSIDIARNQGRQAVSAMADFARNQVINHPAQTHNAAYLYDSGTDTTSTWILAILDELISQDVATYPTRAGAATEVLAQEEDKLTLLAAVRGIVGVAETALTAATTAALARTAVKNARASFITAIETYVATLP